MKLVGLLAPFLLLVSSHSLQAQLGLYGTFTAQDLSVPDNSGFNLYGGTLGAYLASGQVAILSAGVDLRGSYTKGNSTSFIMGAIGPRIGLNIPIIHPYVEGLIGVANIDVAGGSPLSGTRFEYQFLGGLDFTIFPRLDWRVAEFSYGGMSSNDANIHPKTLSTGLVLRLPRFFPIP
jgi:hypothetical protein